MVQLDYKVRKGGVPVLSDTQIDEDAEYLLRQYNADLLRQPQPLDIEDFTERFLGFNIHYDNLSNNGCIWGQMVFNNRKILVYDPDTNGIAYHPVDANTVVVDNSLLVGNNEYALRSTMAHECGHGLYHPQIYREDDNQLSLFPVDNKSKTAVTVCRSVDIGAKACNGKRKLTSDHDWIEHHAKYMSAALLMPKSMMKAICGNAQLRTSLSQECPGFEEEFLANHISEVFNVSPASAKIRIKQLGFGFDEAGVSRSIFSIGYPSNLFYV